MKRWCLMVALIVLCWALPVRAAETLRAAVAANFIAPFQELTALYQARTGVKVEPAFSSSGTLYAQIVQGAPFDLFLSADEDRPRKLSAQGLGTAPFIYARGRVVIWSTKKEFCAATDWQAILIRADVNKIALANPETAPYGAAAKKALQEAKLWDAIQTRLVFPQDIAQAFQYASTGAVDVGFCALSATFTAEGKRGCFIPVAQAPDIIQAGCVVSTSPNKTAANAFAAFLRSKEAATVIERYGYRLD